VHKYRRGRRVGPLEQVVEVWRGETTHGCANREGALHRGNFEIGGVIILAAAELGRNIPAPARRQQSEKLQRNPRIFHFINKSMSF
jgi:hypothetical protein